MTSAGGRLREDDGVEVGGPPRDVAVVGSVGRAGIGTNEELGRPEAARKLEHGAVDGRPTGRANFGSAERHGLRA